ncbi:MAG: alpha/beta hydrolase [Candidatus Competibacterales bacterium]
MTPTPFPSPTPSPLPPLEILQRAPAGEARPGTLLFVHGAFSGAWCWDVHFLPYFAAAGYRCLAVSLRGHGNSPGRHTLAWHTMADYVADVACAAANLPRPLVLIGHSMGGFVIQKYLEKHPLPQAVVLLASVAPWGLWPSSLNLALKDPELFQQLQLLQWWGPTWVSRAYARRALFSEELPEADVVRFTELSQRESVQAL